MPEPVREDAKAKFATCLDQFGKYLWNILVSSKNVSSFFKN